MITASWRELRRMIARADVVIEVVDARDPMGTRCRRLERMVERMGKKLLIVINKADMVPREAAEEWKRLLEDQGYHVVYMSAKGRMGTRVLRRAIRRLCDRRPVTVAVVGYPKVGKSTIINALKGRSSASTSPIPGSPGYTRRFQYYRAPGDIRLIDSPGILPPTGDLVERAIRGMPPEQLSDPVKPAIELLRRALKYNPDSVKKLYKVDVDDPYEILKQIALRRGWAYKRDREPNIDEAAREVLRDWHRGRLVFYITPRDYISEGSSRTP